MCGPDSPDPSASDASLLKDVLDASAIGPGALQQEQALILDHVPALIWYKDTANLLLRVNTAVARLLGLPKEQIEGRHTSEFYPEEADRYYQDDLIVIQTGEPRLGIVEPQRLPSGERRWIRTDKIPLKDAFGQVTRILVMALDITAQKEIEEALRISQDDLNRAQSVARIGSWRLDVRRDVLTWSDENYHLFGMPLGSPLSYATFLSAVHPEDRERVDQAWQAALNGEQYEIEHRVIVAGETKWFREKAELEFDDRGQLLGGFGTTQDVTERRGAAEARREADRCKDEFLAILAHELRNPLAPIKNATEIMRMSRDDATLNRCRELIERQVEHLTHLVDDLLDIARISRGRIELKSMPLSVADIVERAIETSQPLIDARRHRLTVRLSPDRLYVAGDLIRLAQVVSNLLHNAVKFTEPGGHIRLSVEQEGSEAVLRVSDTGIGISPAMIDSIFEMFVQADSSRNKAHGGLGIGLSFARQIVILHGGTLTATSAGEGCGSEFVVRLPRLANPVQAPAKTTQDAAASRHRILVADDNADVADSLAMLLDILGQEVRVARDGLEAVQIADEFQPELILLDLGMPRLDGYGACRRLRAEQSHRRVIIAALSGWGQPQDKTATEAAGFDHHLVKPASLPDLQHLLETLS